MEIVFNGGSIAAAVRSEASAALLAAGQHLAAASAAQAPIDTGRLKSSCLIDSSKLAEGEVTVGYAQQVDSYALRQHEGLAYHHPKGGKAKFLEDPFRAHRAQYIGSLGAAVARGLMV